MVSSSDVQRLFLQAVISRRYLSHEMAKILWQKSIDAVKAADESLDIAHSDSANAWSTFIKNVNDSMNSLDMEIVTLHDETTGDPMHVLVNRKGDELAQLASDYAPHELAFFKALVDLIMTAPNESYCISSLAALRELNELKTNVTKTQGEIILNSFVARGWLHRTQYVLSTRSSLELQSYIKSTYADDILECVICLELLTRGIRCCTKNCQARMHNHCYKNYRRNKSNCPNCSQNWADEHKLKHVGEAAYKDGQDRHQARVRATVDSGEEVDEEEVEPPQRTQTRSRTQTRKRTAKKSAPKEESTDVEDEDENKEDSPPPTRLKWKGRR